MKGLIKWLKYCTKMKRWILIIFIGILCTCNGITGIISEKELAISNLIFIIISFIIGFLLIILGLVFSQKRILEILIQESNTSMQEETKDLGVKSLIFNKKIFNEGPKIVVIGGGNGLSNALRGLKKYTSNITAIVETSKNLEKTVDPKMSSFECIKESIISLAENEEKMRKLLYLKMNKQAENSLTFGDVLLLSMNDAYGDYLKSINNISDTLKVAGNILPVTLDEISICAELKDGTTVEGKDVIPNVVSDKVEKINRVYISPTNCRPAPGVLEAIQEADAIIIGPGSLYTNVIPNLLIKNVARTIKESKALKIYVSNIMTEPGQTDDFSLSDHLNAIIEHVGEGVIDYCLYDTGEIVPEFIKLYNKKGSDIVEFDIQKAKETGIKLIQNNFSHIQNDSIIHDPELLAETIIQMICDEMRFKDKQNDSQYVMLSTKLKETQKNKPKKIKERVQKPKAKRMNKKSKFAQKYDERIKSIQTSEEERLRKITEIEEDDE